MEREYLIRVTRHPLTKEQIKSLSEQGELPRDYRNRSVTASDFVKVTADTDETAALNAIATTSLTFNGESATVEEALPGDEYRALWQMSDPIHDSPTLRKR